MQEQFSNVDWSATAAMMAALVAFFSLIVSPIVSYKIAKKQITATVLSNERKEWINELRLNLSKLISLLMDSTLINTRKSEAERNQSLDNFRNLTSLQSQIMLMLDTDDENQSKLNQEVMNTISIVSAHFSNPSSNAIDAVSVKLDEIANLSRLVIKNEYTSLIKR